MFRNTNTVERPPTLAGRDQRLDGEIITGFRAPPGTKIRSDQPGVGLRTGIHRLLALPTRHRSHSGHASRARVAGVGTTGQRWETTGSRVGGVATTHPIQLRHRAGEETIVDITELVVCGVTACSATGIV